MVHYFYASTIEMKIKIPRYIQWITLSGFSLLIVMFLLRLVFYFVYPPAVETPKILDAFVLGLRYDLRIVSIVTLVVFIFGSIPPLNPVEKKAGKRIAFTLFTIFCVLIALFYTVDFANYAYLKQRMNATLLNYVEDAGISAKMVWQTYPVFWLIVALILGTALLITLITFCYNFVLSRQRTTRHMDFLIWGFVFFMVAGIGIFGRVGQFPLRWSDAYRLGNDYASNLAFNPFQSFFSSLKFRHSSYDKAKLTDAYPLIAAYIQPDNPQAQPPNYLRTVNGSDSTSKPNIVLVICESFSGYKSSAFGNQLNTTPFFDSLTQEGIFFDHCFTPSYGTARGVWATLTGIPDVELSRNASRNPGMVDQHIIINDFNGYEKYYFLGGSASWANIRGVLTNNIHNLHLFEEGDYEAQKVDVWGISDKNLFLEAAKALSKEQKPFFAIIQTADNHRPYTIPKEDEKAFNKIKLPKDTLEKYGFESNEELNAFRYTDFSFKVFMEAAKKYPFFDNTIFVFIGDHGIPGNARGVLPSNYSEMGLTSTHVPLLFVGKPLQKKQRLGNIASQIDVMPTIAGFAGVSYTNASLGRDLMKPHPVQNMAFYFDPEGRRMGIIKDSIFFLRNIADAAHNQTGNIKSNRIINISDEEKQLLNRYTEAWFETARYLLYNNKKQQ